MDIVEAWASYRPRSTPFMLPADADVLASDRSRAAIVVHRSWKEAHRATDFGQPGDTRLHLGVLPMPFIGNLQNASVYILLLNPGLSPDDYFGESQVPSYRNAVLANLRQAPRDAPFLFLDPAFAWHAGFGWWQGKLARVIGKLATAWGVSFAAARTRVARSIASIELFPYHSAGFRDSGRWLRELPSVALARAFVAGYVMDRVRSGKAIAIVTRKSSGWNLPRARGIVVYSGQQARAAHLTPDSPGGHAILQHLSRRS